MTISRCCLINRLLQAEFSEIRKLHLLSEGRKMFARKWSIFVEFSSLRNDQIGEVVCFIIDNLSEQNSVPKFLFSFVAYCYQTLIRNFTLHFEKYYILQKKSPAKHSQIIMFDCLSGNQQYSDNSENIRETMGTMSEIYESNLLLKNTHWWFHLTNSSIIKNIVSLT